MQAEPALRGLAPVVDARTRIVVLGSFPGEASLRAQQYYAHPRNQFWRILGDVVDDRLPRLAYSQRIEVLLAHGIGVWDVLQACERRGSLDSAIRRAQPNDFRQLLRAAPLLVRTCHNGKLSGRFAAAITALGIDAIVLPSTSPAYASVSYDAKCAAWRDALRRAA